MLVVVVPLVGQLEILGAIASFTVTIAVQVTAGLVRSFTVTVTGTVIPACVQSKVLGVIVIDGVGQLSELPLEIVKISKVVKVLFPEASNVTV